MRFAGSVERADRLVRPYDAVVYVHGERRLIGAYWTARTAQRATRKWIDGATAYLGLTTWQP